MPAERLGSAGQTNEDDEAGRQAVLLPRVRRERLVDAAGDRVLERLQIFAGHDPVSDRRVRQRHRQRLPVDPR